LREVLTQRFKIKEYAEARIYKNGEFVELVKFPDASFNSISSYGKNKLANLVGGLESGTQFDSMWVVVDGTVSPPKSLNPPTESGGTLVLEPISPFTLSGDYSAVLTGNGSEGPSNYYSSISTSLTLPASSEVEFTVKIIISGAESGYYGNRIAASVWGGVSGDFNSPITKVAVYDGSTLKGSTTTNNSVSGNTLTVSQPDPFSGSLTINKVEYQTDTSGDNGKFDKFDGFTISVDSGTDLLFEAQFVFG